jgi:hypothetical protein
LDNLPASVTRFETTCQLPRSRAPTRTTEVEALLRKLRVALPPKLF